MTARQIIVLLPRRHPPAQGPGARSSRQAKSRPKDIAAPAGQLKRVENSSSTNWPSMTARGAAEQHRRHIVAGGEQEAEGEGRERPWRTCGMTTRVKV